MKLKHLILSFAVFAALFSCTRTDAPLPEEDMLYRVECFYQQNPDSALQILDTLRLDRLSEKELAHYYLLWVKVNEPYWAYKPESDSMLNEAVQYFLYSNDLYFKALTLMITARFEKLAGNEAESVKNELQALEVIEQCKHVDERLVLYSHEPTDEQNEIDRIKYSIYTRLGMGYMANSLWDEGLYYMHLANRYYTEKQRPFFQILTLVPMGMTYVEKKDFDSSYYCYSEALRLSAETHDNLNYFQVCDALAQYYLSLYDNKRFENDEEKEALLRNAIRWHKTELDTLATLGEAMFLNRSIDGYGGISSAYLELQQYDSSIYYAEKGLIGNGRNVWKENLKKYLFKSHFALSNYEKAAMYAEDLFKNLDLETQKDNEIGVNLAKSESEKHNELQQLQNENQQKRLHLYILLLLLFIALLTLFFFYYRYRKNKELEMMRIQSEQQKLQSEQQQLQSDIESKKQQSHAMLIAHARKIYYKDGDDNDGKVFGSIMTEFNAQYPNAQKKLKAALPDFTDSEIDILILWSLSFQIKDMAHILGLSENTVAKYRSNIRQKTKTADILGLIKPILD